MTRAHLTLPTRSFCASRGLSLLFSVFILLTFATSASAQVTTGTPPFASFTGGPDIINLANLNSHLNIPIVLKKGRGLDFNFYLTYDSSVWYPVGSSGSQVWAPVTNLGWSGSDINMGRVLSTVSESGPFFCATHKTRTVYTYSWRYIDGYNATHYYGTSQVIDDQCNGNSQTSFTAGPSDNSGYLLSVTGANVNSLYDTTGNLIWSNGTGIEDRNGNFISKSGSGFTDTLGATALTISGVAPSPTTYSYTAPSGSGSVTSTTSYVYYTVATNFAVSGISEYGAHAVYLIDRITLPDTTYYQFVYEQTPSTPSSGSCAPLSGTYQSYCVTGRVSKVVLPAGGYVAYSYSGGAGTNGSGIFTDGTAATLQRTINDGTTSNTWTYARTLGSGAPSATRVTDPLGNDTIIQFQTIYETQRDAYNGAGPTITSVPIPETTLQTASLLGEVQTCYNASATPCTSTFVSPGITQRDILPSIPSAGSATLQSKTTTKYNSAGMPTELDAYSFGSGAVGVLLRQILITYASLANITGFRQTVTVKNAFGTTFAQTNNNYDQTTPVAAPSGTVQLLGAPGSSRGNLTSVQRCTVLSNCSSYLQTTMTYDTAGQLQSITDPLNNQTTFAYNDAFLLDDGSNPPSNTYTPTAPTDAFPTKITPPISGSINLKYYYYNGALALSTDQNNNNRWSHFDSLGRPLSTYGPSLPIAGTQNMANPWTLITYTPPKQIDTYSDINDGSTTASSSCSVCRHDEAVVDGLGRTISSLLKSDPEGQTEVDISYDGLGRTKNGSHPYRSVNDSTYGLENLTYDALGRTIKVTHPDGTYSQILYGAAVSGSGVNTTQLCPSSTYGLAYPILIIDEAGNKRESWDDALGRTIEADEPDSSGNLTSYTCYSYDPLGNLLKIAHGNQIRTYVYDALSRPTSVTIPERANSSGANCPVTYTYDNDSNVHTRTTPAPNQTSCATTIMTTYAYDALNRVTNISYGTTSPVVTPTVQYAYDGNTLSGCSTSPPSLTDSNPKGLMTSMCDGSGATSWAHDAAGRVITEIRKIIGASIVSQTLAYSYNLDGSVSTVTYPSGRSVTYTVSNAQRLTAANDVANSVVFATAGSYAAPGMLQGLITGQINGGFSGVTESDGYNYSLEYASTQATSSAGPALNLGLTYNLPGGDNGTVTSITNNIDSGRTETLGYDTLNRILSAQSSATSGTDCWGQVYGATGTASGDALGNLTNINSGTQTQPPCPLGRLSVGVDGNNHISSTGVGYDAAGNMLQDGSGYTYSFDAENNLVQASGMSGGPYCYVYDGRGLRVAKKSGANSDCSGGSYTKLYWRSLSADTMAETDGSGSTGNSAYNEYVFFAGRKISSRNGSGAIFYNFADQLGSTRAITTGSGTGQTPGQLCYDADFTPYGQEISYTGRLQSSVCPPNYKFTGYERDSETGLDYAFARYYSPLLGRFLSTDPLGGALGDLQSEDAYTYTENNPVNLTDPSGLCPGQPGCPPRYSGPQCESPLARANGGCTSLPPGACDWGGPLCGGWGNWYDPLVGFPAIVGYTCMFGIDCHGAAGTPGAMGWQPVIGTIFVTGPVDISDLFSDFTLGLRRPGQSFNECMVENSSNYSAGGAIDLSVGLDEIGTSTVGQIFTGNMFTGAYAAVAGSGPDLVISTATIAPDVASAGMGSVITYGRRTSDIVSLNLAGRGGLPKALSGTTTAGVKSGMGGLSRIFNLGLELSEKAVLDVSLFGAEGVGCKLPK